MMAKQDPDQSITVLLVDDHPVVRDGYRHLLENTPDIHVVAEANDGETGCALYRKQAPDVVILDLNMPGIGGLETLRRIRAYDPDARILIFSMHGDKTMLVRALEAGATGYLTKQCGMGKMVEAVRQVAQGNFLIDSNHAAARGGQPASADDPLGRLSRREFQIFKLLAEGNSVAEIAAKISISPKTVGGHHTNIMKKLELSNHSQLTRLAIRCNILEP